MLSKKGRSSTTVSHSQAHLEALVNVKHQVFFALQSVNAAYLHSNFKAAEKHRIKARIVILKAKKKV